LEKQEIDSNLSHSSKDAACEYIIV